MDKKLFGIVSVSMIVLTLLVAPVFAEGEPAGAGPLPEPPGVGGGNPGKPSGNDTEYEWFPGDPAWLECERVGGGDYPYSVRIGTGSALDPYGLTRTVYGNTISVEEIWELGKDYPVEFNWHSDPDPIGIVIVKSGRAAAVYYYDEGVTEDEGLLAIYPWEPSHLTFCWGSGNEPSEPPPPICEWTDETAWGAGYPYNVDEQGNWATYTPYPVIIDDVEYDGVIIYAGQGMEAGTLTFSQADGMVTLTILLDDVWRFAPVEENVKIQPYDEPPPDGNPVPGLFEYKYTAEESPFVVEVPLANYYGIHLDLEWGEYCE